MSEPTFTISDDGKAITCHRCGATSHNANDVAFHYCGRCNHWHEGPNLLNAKSEAAYLLHTQAMGKLIARVMPGAKFFLTTYQDIEGGRVGVDKFGVSIATNIHKADMLKLLKLMVAHVESNAAPEVIVKTE
jgi:hypothetical protein